MNIEHLKVMQTMTQTELGDINLVDLMEYYSTLQTKYLGEDLSAGVPVVNFIVNEAYANRALSEIKEVYDSGDLYIVVESFRRKPGSTNTYFPDPHGTC